MTQDNHIGSKYLLGELDRMIRQAEDSKDDEKRTTFVVLKGIYLELKQVKSQIKGVEDNPFFIAGEFAKNNPKKTGLILAFIFVMLNFWFVSGLRQPWLMVIFHWLGLPEEFVP